MKKILFSCLLLGMFSLCSFGQNYVPYASPEVVNLPTEGSSSCIPKNAFGIDIGIGSVEGYRTNMMMFSAGIRYLHHFGSYFGMDFLKINYQFVDFDEHNMQFMSGIRLNSPTFYRCMSGYGSIRFGWGGLFDFDSGFCYEVEIGFNLTRSIFLGYSFNQQPGDYRHHSLRIGFNLGK